jgi:hypothetical protein
MKNKSARQLPGKNKWVNTGNLHFLCVAQKTEPDFCVARFIATE